MRTYDYPSESATSRRLFRRTSVAIAAVMLLITACGSGDGQGDEDAATSTAGPTETHDSASSTEPSSSTPVVDFDPDGEAVFTVQGTPDTLDPFASANLVHIWNRSIPLYDRLTQILPGPVVAPMVATSWEFSDDGLTLTFDLRDDVSFHDGTSLDAAAVKASLDFARDPDNDSSLVQIHLDSIDEIEVPDPATVVLTLNRPFAELPAILSTPAGAIVNPSALGSDLSATAYGSGPYVVDLVVLGDRVSYARADNYWDPDAQRLSRIEFIGMPDDIAKVNALRSGQVNGIWLLTTPGISSILDSLRDDFIMAEFVSSWFSITLNMAEGGPLADVRVRQALNHAIDRDAINETIFDGLCPATSQALPPSMAGHDDTLVYDYDLDRARELLADAGYADGFEMTILSGIGLNAQEAVSTVVQSQLQEIGVSLEIVPVDASELSRRFAQGEADSASLNRLFDITPSNTLRSGYGVARFPQHFSDEFVQALSDASDATKSDAEREAGTATANRIASDEAYEIFVCLPTRYFVYEDGYVGIEEMGLADAAGIYDVRYVGVKQ